MVIKEGYKQTEIGVIPNEWHVHSLKDEVSSLDAGISVNSVNEKIDIAHDYAILKTSCVSNGTFNPLEAKKIKSNDIKRAKLNPKKGRIIISRMNTPDLVGECGYVTSDFPTLFLPDRLWMMEFKKTSEINSKWLNYILNYSTYRQKIREIGTGTSGSMKNISKEKLLEILIPFPSSEEQTAIATALSDADGLITGLEKLIAKKRNIKQGAMQQLLQPKEGWEVKKLGEISQIYTGKKNNQDKVENGKYPFFVRSKTIESINSYSFDGEAILIPGEGNIGSIFHYINGKFDYHQRVYKISDFNDKYSGKYIYRYITEHFGKHAMQNSVKATVDSLRLPTFQVFEIPFPPSKEEQTRIATILSDMDAELSALEQKLEKYKKVKLGMMQELLTGKTRLV